MSTAYPMDTPESLAKRMQHLEDMELPSLPTIQHDIDYDSGSMTGGDTSVGEESDHSERFYNATATPHPLRQTYIPASTSSRNGSNASSESSTGSPFPPVGPTGRYNTPSPYVPNRALTSTPHTVPPKQARSVSDDTRSTFRRSQTGHTRTRSGTTDLGSSQKSERERWQTPLEMSRSFSIDEIPLQELSGNELEPPTPGPTPLTRRLSEGNVVLDRRSKRGASGSFLPLHSIREVRVPSPIESEINTPQRSPLTASPHLDVEQKERVPSLSRSGTSADETDHAATTPEGPSRNPLVATPTGRGGATVPSSARRINWDELVEEEQTDAEDYTVDEETDAEPYEEQESMAMPSLGSILVSDSPAKAQTPAISTPGVGRLDARHQSPSYVDYQATPRAFPLNDVTSAQNTPAQTPYTPAKFSEVATPRPGLSDAERRKNHVLAVLSTGPASRIRPVRGTPHPLRRVSTVPTTESILEDSMTEGGLSAGPTARERSMTQEQSYVSANESFVSVASSADLTSDRRATTHTNGLIRANTSFPTILLPTNHSGGSPAASARLGGESRADGIKIHKHLNAMNKQLLDANADLAREAEGWRGEVDRLMAILHEAGIEVEEVDIAAQVGNTSDRERLEAPQHDTTDANITSEARSELLDAHLSAMRRRRSMSPGEGSAGASVSQQLSPQEQEAILEEMAQRLEEPEAGLNEKDEVIADLEQRIADGIPADSSMGNLQAEIDQLRQRLEEAEETRVQLHSEFAVKTEQHAKQFGEICADFEGQIKALEEELARTQADRRAAVSQEDSAGDDSEVRGDLHANVDDLERKLEEAQHQRDVDQAEITDLRTRIDADLARHRELVEKAEDAERRLLDAQGRVDEADEAVAELDELRARLEELEQERGQGQDGHSSGSDARETGRISEELEHEIATRDEQIHELSDHIKQLEADLEAVDKEDKQVEQDLLAEVNRLNALVAESNDLLATKEAELESARAKADISSGNAGDEEALQAMEGHLEEAYREIGRLKQQMSGTPHLKTTLEVRDARIQALEREKAALLDRLAGIRENSPGVASMMVAASPFKATPFVNKAIASLRMPKTPGSIQELSWLQTTVGDANEPILRAQIDQLQNELENANGQLDANFSRLEAAGLNGLELAKELAAAQERIEDLENELRSLAQKNKASLALLSEQRERTGRNGDARLEAAMDAVQRQMDDLQADMKAERARLQKENKRMSALVSELRRDHAVDLQAVKSGSDKQLAESSNELRRVKHELDQAIRERDDLRRATQTSERQLRELEMKLDESRAEHASLQRRHRDSAVSHETKQELEEHRRIVLRLQDTLENTEVDMDRLRRSLQGRQSALDRAETKVSDLLAERRTIAGELAEFETELSKQRKEAQRFGVELQRLKVDQEGKAAHHEAEVESGRLDAARAKDQLKRVERELERVEREQRALARQKDTSAEMNAALQEQKARFKTQMQYLAVQIQYLMAKFTRETMFRKDLALQKRYLLLLVGGMSLNEQATLKQIAAMGFPVPAAAKRRRSFKAVALAVVGLVRAKRLASEWKGERQVKVDAVATREERKRIEAASR